MEQIAEQVKSLPVSEREELLPWLAEFELDQTDSWEDAACPAWEEETPASRCRT